MFIDSASYSLKLKSIDALFFKFERFWVIRQQCSKPAIWPQVISKEIDIQMNTAIFVCSGKYKVYGH